MDVLQAILNRRSVREYSDKPMPHDVLAKLRTAMRAAPSACNFQPWKFVFIQDAGLRKQVAQASKEQRWMAEAPLIVAACGRPADAYPRMGGYGNSVDIDLAIALDHLMLAAVAEGLGTCWIGAFDEQAVKQLLGVPQEVKVVGLTPVGYPRHADLIAPLPDDRRKTEAELFSTDRF